MGIVQNKRRPKEFRIKKSEFPEMSHLDVTNLDVSHPYITLRKK